MQISGTAERQPHQARAQPVLYCAGINAAYASLAGYLAARRTGAGVALDLSMHETLASQLVMNEPYYAFVGAIQGRRSATQDPFSGEPIPAADGYVSLQSTTLTPVASFAQLFHDERLADPQVRDRGRPRRACGRIGGAACRAPRQRQSRDVFEAAGARGLLAGFVQSAAQLLTCPQLRARSMWRVDPELGTQGKPIHLPSRFAEMSATPVRDAAPAPKLGADNGFSPRSTPSHSAGAPTAPPGETGPFSGMLVIDLSTVFAVPYIGALLADLGAEVVKVEAPGGLTRAEAASARASTTSPAATTGTEQRPSRGSIAENARSRLTFRPARADRRCCHWSPRPTSCWTISPRR